MDRSPTRPRIRHRLLGGAALVALVGGGLVATIPALRHRAELVTAQVLNRGVHIVARQQGDRLDVVAASRSPMTDPALDARFAPKASAEVTVALQKPDVTGSIALPATIDGRTPQTSSAFEVATLETTPALDGGTQAKVDVDFGNARQAILLYRKGSIPVADDFARSIASPTMRTALEWVALRFNPGEAGADRLKTFVAQHGDWPTLPWFNRRIEEVSLGDGKNPAAIKAQFATAKPQTLVSQLSLARADRATGDDAAAATIVREIWRSNDLTAGEEAVVLKDFGPLLRREDHKFRADRLLYKEQVDPALRAAALAGPDVKLLAMARAAAFRNAAPAITDAAIAAVPKPLANDPGLIFARVQRARHAGRLDEAQALLGSAPRDPDLLINGDQWWTERRLLARKLLDAGNPKAAYAVCAGHAAMSDTATIEAEFHAGWIALRFLDDPKSAATHFAAAAQPAETPMSRSRVAYWQARAAEGMHDTEAAKAFYQTAALQPISFYGQLASGQLGRTSIDLHPATAAAEGDDRREAIRVVEMLYALGERDVALPLAFDIAKTETSDAQLQALSAILTRAGDARATLMVGKFATQRGLALDETAFPTFGIPDYQPLTNSADRAVVYAIARQESEFDPKAVSSAGAKGLMQMITPTARATALKFGVAFDDERLLSDAAFNAQLGAAHLGQLLNEQRGSYILTFAAYNAGSQRVKEWIDAYGDPRQPGVDPIDWVERIPFTETRNYVQRVFENLQVYRLRFGPSSKLLMVGAEAATARKGT